MIQRREFITIFGGAAAAWPIAARAQQPGMPVVGFLGSSSPDQFADRVQTFQQGLEESGYFLGQNAVIEYRWANDQNEVLPALALDLVRRKVNVIATTGGSPTAIAAKNATTTIPIVFHLGSNPVQIGLVASLNRPGGNITGVTTLNVEVAPKRLELMRELVPSVTIALLENPTNPINRVATEEMQTAARTLGVDLQVLHAANQRDLETVFDRLVQLRMGAIVVSTDPYFLAQSAEIARLAERHRVPAIHGNREFAVAGGLMSYGSSLAASSRQAGIYTGRVLSGEKPADLPVVQATRVELIINLKTAKALGLTIPLSLLGRADEVIE